MEGQGEGLAVITDVTYSSQTISEEEEGATGSKEEYQRIQVVCACVCVREGGGGAIKT